MINLFIKGVVLANGFWTTVGNLLLFFVVLGLIVGIHEFGHFIFARRGGILCREYAIGMGPRLLKYKPTKSETVYSLRAFPLGGFCSIAGEEVEDDPLKAFPELKLDIKDGIINGFYLDVNDDKAPFPKYKVINYDIYDAENTGNLFMTVETEEGEVTYSVNPQAIIYTRKDEFQIAPYNRTLLSKSKGRRAMVMFGGPLFNMLLAIVVFFIVGLFSGFINNESNVVGEVSSNMSISEKLKAGDAIEYLETSSLGKSDKITTWTAVTEYLKEYDDKGLAEEIVIYFTRDGESMQVSSTPFIAINSAGFGSTIDYLDTNETIIGAYEEFGDKDDLGNNSLIKLGDKIISINLYGETPIVNPSWAQVRSCFNRFTGENDNDDYNKVYMKVTRTTEGVSENLDVYVEPYSKKLLDKQTTITGNSIYATDASVGIGASTKFSFIRSIGYAFERTWGSFTAVFDTLALLFSGSVSVKNLSGPIGIFSLTAEVAQYGILYILSLVGLLSVNIGLLNLFPIPALDGGRLVFLAYEAITKKKPNQKVETVLITITFVLLMGLMIFVAYEDIMRLIN